MSNRGRATLMASSYRQCSECGKRALSIATRCPACGRELPPPVAPAVSPALDLRRFLSPRVAGGIILTAVVLTAAEQVRSSRPLRQSSSVLMPDSTSEKAQVADAMAAGDRRSTAAAAPLPAASAGEVLVARTWTNVRKSRSARADVVAKLLPADTVLADSLERSWYRVAMKGKVLGYVYRSTLAAP